MADRVTQVVAEAVITPTSQNARVSQVVAEAVITPTSQNARVSQVVVEVISQNAPAPTATPRTYIFWID